jgi:hypothetical protein
VACLPSPAMSTSRATRALKLWELLELFQQGRPSLVLVLVRAVFLGRRCTRPYCGGFLYRPEPLLALRQARSASAGAAVLFVRAYQIDKRGPRQQAVAEIMGQNARGQGPPEARPGRDIALAMLSSRQAPRPRGGSWGQINGKSSLPGESNV